MPPSVVTIVFAAGIAGLFFLDRGEKSRVSAALWIPTVWLFITASRAVSQWLGMKPAGDAASVYIEGSPIDRTVFAVLEAIALIVVVSRGRRTGFILRKNWIIGIFFLYAALSMFWSDYPLVTFKHWIKGMGDVLMVVIVATEPNIADAIKRLVTRIGFVLLPLSVLFIKYYPELGRRLTLSWTMEPVGVTTQKNGLGELCDLVGLGLLWRFRTAYNARGDPNRRRRMAAIGMVLATIVWLLWMCNSMTSICALSMASAVMLLSTRPAFRRRPSLVHLLIFALLTVAVCVTFFPSLGGIVQTLGRDPTLTGRTDNWPRLLAMPNNPLVGVGYETFWLGPRLLKLWELTGFNINEAHNGYIEVFINLGWVGVGLLGVLIATGYRNIIGAYRQAPDISSLRMAFFLATLVTGFTEAAFRMVGPPWIFFLLVTAAAQWMPQRKIPAIVNSNRHRIGPRREAGPVRDGAPAAL